MSSFYQIQSQPLSWGCLGRYRKRNVQGRQDTGERTMGGEEGSFTWQRRWERPLSGRRAPWPLRGQSPVWCGRRAVASEKGSCHNKWWGTQNSPNSRPRACHPYCGSLSPSKSGCCVMCLEMALVWKLQLELRVVRWYGAAKLLRPSPVSVSPCFSTTVDCDQLSSWEVLTKEEVETNLAQVYIFRGCGALAEKTELHNCFC